MPAITTRQEARERLLKTALSAIDRLVPADQSVPLRGSTFADFENQSYEVGDAILTAMMEERAKLGRSASVNEPGPCQNLIADRIGRTLRRRGLCIQQENPLAQRTRGHCQTGRPLPSLDGSFPPQLRDWLLCSEAALTPKSRSARRTRNRNADV